MIKKLIRWLLLWDALWSWAIAFGAFMFGGLVLQGLFSDGDETSVGLYDPSFWQAALYSIGLTVMFSGAALVGQWINFKGYWKYIYSKNSTIKNDFTQLTPWQKFFSSHFSYYFYILVMLAIWAILL